MENKRNYYRLLHVQFDAPAPVIKSSYRTMMQKMRLHPDLGGDKGNAQLLNRALATLLDPNKRALYDQWLKAHQPESLKSSKRSTGKVVPAKQAAKATSSSPEASRKNGSIDLKLMHCLFCRAENHLSDTHDNIWLLPMRACKRCKAPLNKVDKVESSTSDELRRMHRNMLNTTCEIQVSADSVENICAQVLDFSVLGLCVEHKATLGEGMNVLIRSENFACVALVSYSTNNADGPVTSGLEFLTLDLTMPRGELFTAIY